MAEPTDEDIVETEDDDAEVIEEENESDKGDEKAPVRKSAAYFVGLRQGKKQGREEAKEKGDDEEVELTPNARAAIRKELEPIVRGMKESADDIEVREYLSSHPEHQKYEKAIRRRMEAWKEVPVDEIAKTVAFGEESTKRQQKKEEVESKAKGSKMGGSSSRAEEPKLPSTQAEFAEIYKRVKRGESIKLGE